MKRKKNQVDIMTFEEYVGLCFDIPYTFDVSFGAKRLTFYGCHHSWEPSHLQFTALEKLQRRLCPDVVFVEAARSLRPTASPDERRATIDRFRSLSRKATIRAYGETGFMIWLSIGVGSEVVCPEYSQNEEFRLLLAHGFDRAEVVAYYFHREVPQWVQGNRDTSFADYMQKTFSFYYHHDIAEPEMLSLDWMERMSHQIWGSGIEFDDPDLAQRRVSPSYGTCEGGLNTKINVIARELNYIRDRKIIAEALDQLQHVDQLLIVYGASHAVMQKRVWHNLSECFGADVSSAAESWMALGKTRAGT